MGLAVHAGLFFSFSIVLQLNNLMMYYEIILCFDVIAVSVEGGESTAFSETWII